MTDCENNEIKNIINDDNSISLNQEIETASSSHPIQDKDAFEKLSSLQKLVFKQAGLKDLCKKKIYFKIIYNIVIKERDDIIKDINNNLEELWDLKFAITKEKLKKLKKNNENVEYKLNHGLDCFDLDKVYISSLLKNLWLYPESIYYIIKNSNNDECKENLADFIINRFFSHNLSGNYLENNLLYVITMLLKNEIDKLRDKSEISLFLEETKASFLLEEMIQMPDIQLYFRKVIYRMVERVENYGAIRKINFNLKSTAQDLDKFIEEEERKMGKNVQKTKKELCLRYLKTKILEQDMNEKDEEDSEEKDNEIMQKIKLNESFIKYAKNIEIKELENLILESEKKNNKDLAQYIQLLIYNIKSKNCPSLYWNNILDLINKEKEEDSEENEDNNNKFLSYIYQQDFIGAISFLEIFFEDLLNNTSIMPNSIKYICKIIYILIKNKFNNITKVEIYAWISRFFIDKLLIPILNNPSINALINDFVISGNTPDNLLIIIFIIKKIFSGKLFEKNYILPNGEDENNYTLFNRFILEEIESIIKFYDKATNVTLPGFIEKYINNKLPSDYLYDYFEENPEEIYVSISICFNINNIIALVKGLQKCQNDLFTLENAKITRLKRIFSKLNKDQKLMQLKNIGNNVENIIENSKSFTFGKKHKLKNNKADIKTENYYIFNDCEIEKKYEYLFKINNKIDGFYIDIKKLEKNRKIEDEERNIIKLKNYLITSLRNYSIMQRSLFNSTSNISEILTEINYYMSLDTYLDNNLIPANWSVTSVLHYMKKIPEEYKVNDYEKFFEELTSDLEQSINEFNFEKLFMFKKKKNFMKKLIIYYKECINLLEDINYNEIVKDFVEKSFLPIEVKFYYDDDDEKKFELKKSNIKEKAMKDLDILEDKKNEKVIFRTVSSFIRYFPDLNKYQDKKDINPFQIIKDLSINRSLFHYFDIIKNSFIQDKKICTGEKYDKIYDEKIKNYIMNKIYKKIYPRELEQEDSKLFQKTMHLSWVEPNMIIPGNSSLDVLDNILPDVLSEFKKLNKAHSPFIKFSCIKRIFENIGIIIKFNDGGEGENRDIGAEDITPYLNYVLIRACPSRIFSDIKFIKFFLKNEGKNDYDFMNVEMMCNNILESDYKNFNISETEYIKKCNEAIVNNKNNDDKRFNEIIGRFEINYN